MALFFLFTSAISSTPIFIIAVAPLIRRGAIGCRWGIGEGRAVVVGVGWRLVLLALDLVRILRRRGCIIVIIRYGRIAELRLRLRRGHCVCDGKARREGKGRFGTSKGPPV